MTPKLGDGRRRAQTLISLDANRIATGHIQRDTDVYYLRHNLGTGVCLEIDGTYRITYQPASNRVMELRKVAEKRYGKHILLGTDSGKRSYQKAYGVVDPASTSTAASTARA